MMTEHPERIGGVAEGLGDIVGGAALHEEGTQSFVDPVPGRGGLQEDLAALY